MAPATTNTRAVLGFSVLGGGLALEYYTNTTNVYGSNGDDENKEPNVWITLSATGATQEAKDR